MVCGVRADVKISRIDSRTFDQVVGEINSWSHGQIDAVQGCKCILHARIGFSSHLARNALSRSGTWLPQELGGGKSMLLKLKC